MPPRGYHRSHHVGHRHALAVEASHHGVVNVHVDNRGCPRAHAAFLTTWWTARQDFRLAHASTSVPSTLKCSADSKPRLLGLADDGRESLSHLALRQESGATWSLHQ
jgi:hypothetical protein